MLFRYVDDTFSKLHEYGLYRASELQGPNIKFTVKPAFDGKLAFLDACVHINDDGSTKVTIYCKPTHTDQCLNVDSNHHLGHKRSVVRTLFHQAYTVISEEEDRIFETEHLKSVLRDNNYKARMCKIAEKQSENQQQRSPSVPLPYVQGISEKISHTFRKQGINTYHAPFSITACTS